MVSGGVTTNASGVACMQVQHLRLTLQIASQPTLHVCVVALLYVLVCAHKHCLTA